MLTWYCKLRLRAQCNTHPTTSELTLLFVFPRLENGSLSEIGLSSVETWRRGKNPKYSKPSRTNTCVHCSCKKLNCQLRLQKARISYFIADYFSRYHANVLWQRSPLQNKTWHFLQFYCVGGSKRAPRNVTISVTVSQDALEAHFWTGRREMGHTSKPQYLRKGSVPHWKVEVSGTA